MKPERKLKYNEKSLSIAVKTRRWIERDLTMKEVGQEIGISGKAVWKAENCKGLSNKSFLKICQWLEKEPGAYKIETA